MSGRRTPSIARQWPALSVALKRPALSVALERPALSVARQRPMSQPTLTVTRQRQALPVAVVGRRSPLLVSSPSVERDRGGQQARAIATPRRRASRAPPGRRHTRPGGGSGAGLLGWW